MPDHVHYNGTSIDDTRLYIDQLRQRHDNVLPVFNGGGMWDSKDEMVNAAVAALAGLTGTMGDHLNLFLWEVDADEQWNRHQIERAEEYLIETGSKTGEFLCDYYVGKDLLARGEWGEGKKLPYRRLWKWNGELFVTHEPPELDGGNGQTVLCPQRFKHYAYYYPEDVEFKDQWYSGHGGIYTKWNKLQRFHPENFPRPISDLITGPWGKTDTEIIHTESIKTPEGP